MPNASVQIQYQQELVRNVLQRVDDIFHLKQIVDIKNDKLKDKALASNDQDSTSVFDEVKNREIQRINKENSMVLCKVRVRCLVSMWLASTRCSCNRVQGLLLASAPVACRPFLLASAPVVCHTSPQACAPVACRCLVHQKLQRMRISSRQNTQFPWLA